jgi:hypothetical protein
MPTKDHDDDESKKDKDEKDSPAARLQEAEEYVKNPENMAEFTKKREAREAEAKKKADEAKAKAAEKKTTGT